MSHILIDDDGNKIKKAYAEYKAADSAEDNPPTVYPRKCAEQNRRKQEGDNRKYDQKEIADGVCGTEFLVRGGIEEFFIILRRHPF